MRIDKVYIKNFKNLIDFTIDLDERKMETVLIGQNATGKSNFIEALILIFKHLDLNQDPPFEYKIWYQIKKEYVYILFENGKYEFNTIDKKVQIGDKLMDLMPIPGMSKSEFQKNKNELLPKYVFTYYSGVSNKLKDHFDEHQRRFYDKVKRAGVTKDDVDDLRRLFYVQHIHSYFVLLAYFSFKASVKSSKKFLKEVLSIDDLDSVLFVLRKPNWKGQGDKRFWGASGLVEEFLKTLWDHSLAPIYNSENVKVDFRRSTKRELLYLFIRDKAYLQQVAEDYKSNTDFFKALESTYISDLIDEVRVRVKKNNVDNKIMFKELSEGEQQILTVLGLLRFTTDEESVILLDEPDTHLNPIWKWKYREYLKEVVDKPDSTQIIINTHDPLLIGSMVKEEVRMFTTNENGRVIATMPEVDPKGLGVAGILTSELFNMPTTLDPETQDKLDERNELLVKKHRNKLSQKDLTRLNSIFHDLSNLGITHSSRDPYYEKFLIAISERKEFRPKRRYTKKDIIRQNEIALSILSKLDKGKKMIYVDLKANAPHENWLNEANKVTKELLAAPTLEEKGKIIDKHQKLWGELKDHLAKIAYSKCWYSESREKFSHCHVDHFRPKKAALAYDKKTDQGGYWWLAFEWTNYRYCASVGNVRKKDYFAVKKNKAVSPGDSIDDEVNYLLDPIVIDDPLKLTFTEEGMAKPIISDKESWDYKRADYTIDTLNLNFENLKEARRAVWKECSDLITKVQELLDEEQLNQSAARKQSIKDKMEHLRKLTRPESEFSATAKTCLISTGLIWAMRLAS